MEHKEEQDEKQTFQVIPLTGMVLHALLEAALPPPDVSSEEDLPDWIFEDSISQEEDERPAKRSKPNTSNDEPPPIDYNFIQLSSGIEIYFKEDDGKNILLPESVESNVFVRKVIGAMPRSIKARLLYLAKFMKEKASYDHDRLLYHNLKEQVAAAYLKECRLRSLFRTFVQKWRIRRMNQRYTKEIDPITLSYPEQEIFLYDMTAKKKFVFEAKSLSHIIESALLYHEGGFASPRYPRNPWTNVDFNYLQLLSIYSQLKEYRQVGWCFQTLRQYDFNKSVWHMYHHSTITMASIKHSLRTLDSVDARELLEDFIFSKMDDLHVSTNLLITRTYQTAILRRPNHWYIEQWKYAAFLHYEANHFRRVANQRINQLCQKLFKKQHLFMKEMEDIVRQ